MIAQLLLLRIRAKGCVLIVGLLCLFGAYCQADSTNCVKSSEPYRLEGDEALDFLANPDGKSCFSRELEDLGREVFVHLRGEINSIQQIHPQILNSGDALSIAENATVSGISSVATTNSSEMGTQCKTCWAYEYLDDLSCDKANQQGKSACFDQGKYSHAGKDYSDCMYDDKTGLCNSTWMLRSKYDYDACVRWANPLPPYRFPIGSCLNGDTGCAVGCVLIKRGDSLADATKKEGCTCTAVYPCGHGRDPDQITKIYQIFIDAGATVINDWGCSTFSNAQTMIQTILQLQNNLKPGQCVNVTANQVVSSGCKISSYTSTIKFRLCGGKEWSAEYGSCSPGGACFPGDKGQSEGALCCDDKGKVMCARCSEEGTPPKFQWTLKDWGDCTKSIFSNITCPVPAPPITTVTPVKTPVPPITTGTPLMTQQSTITPMATVMSPVAPVIMITPVMH